MRDGALQSGQCPGSRVRMWPRAGYQRRVVRQQLTRGRMIKFHHNPICRAVADPGSRHHGHRTEALKLHKFVPLLPPVLGGDLV